MKVIGYIRVSTEEQAQGGQSLGAQRDKLEKYAALYDLELAEVIEDPGESGKSLDRPGLQRALAKLRDGEVEGILIVKLDRLTRSVVDLGALLREFFDERAGKSLLSVSDQIDTRSAGGRLVLNVLISVAQWEREAIGERTSVALQHKIKNGERVGRPLYGYTLKQTGVTPKGKPVYELIEDPRQQAGIKRMHDLRKTGLSLRDVAKHLDREGFPTKDGKPWQAATVRQILGREKK